MEEQLIEDFELQVLEDQSAEVSELTEHQASTGTDNPMNPSDKPSLQSKIEDEKQSLEGSESKECRDFTMVSDSADSALPTPADQQKPEVEEDKKCTPNRLEVQEQQEATVSRSNPLTVEFPTVDRQNETQIKTEQTKPKGSETGRVGPVLLFALMACVGGVLGGYSHGFPSPTLLQLELAYESGERITAFSSKSIYEGLFGAIGPIGGLFGGSIAGPVSDRLGRSAALVLMTIPHLIGWLAQAYAQFMPTFDSFVAVLMIGRWFTGFGTGWGSLVITVYMVEISSAKLKGLFGSMYWFSNAVGIFFVYALGAISGFSYSNLSLSTAGLVLVCVLLYCFLPETPRWLAINDKQGELYRVLKLLRGKDTDISVEWEELQNNIKETQGLTWRMKIRSLTSKSVYKPLILSVILMVFQQFTGINVVLFYAETILLDAEVVNANEVAGYAVGITQVLAVFVSVLLVDYLGRKVLLVASSILICISTGMLGLYYFLTDFVCSTINVTAIISSNSSHIPVYCDPILSKFFAMAVVSILLTIIAFSIGWSTIPWVMMGELSPLRVRGILSSVAIIANWGSAAFVTFLFPVYQNAVQPYGSWWTLTGITLLSIPFVVIFVPETKGKSLERIEESFKAEAETAL